VNLHHIRERQDAVQRISGTRAREWVPEDFIHRADEIEVVDAPPERLLSGAEAGDDEVQRLSALRELALLLTADVVEQQVQRYLDAHHVEQLWGSHERIMVCLTPRTDARRLLESGRRNADRFHGELHAVYVEEPDLNQEGLDRVKEHMSLARSLGASVHTLSGADPVATLLEFARASRVTQIFVANARAESWRRRFRKSAVDRIIEGADGMDVRVFPEAEQA
jgi:two-component system sensor histidine kinase KdpD